MHYLKAHIQWKPSDQPNKEIKAIVKGDSFDVMDLLSEDSEYNSDSDSDSMIEDDKNIQNGANVNSTNILSLNEINNI